MGKTLFGIFIILHGLVHIFYFGQSVRWFELSPEFVWPDGAWAFSKLLSIETNRKLAGILLIIATIGFIGGGIGLFANQTWWGPIVTGTAAFSSLLFLLLWDGKTQMLSEKGFIGILINLALLVLLQIFKWPKFGI